MLVIVWLASLLNCRALLCVNCSRAFIDYPNLCTLACASKFAQIAGRKRHVAPHWASVIHNQNIQASCDVAMLKSVIHQNNISGGMSLQILNCVLSVRINCNMQLTMFGMYLHWLIANLSRRRVFVGHNQTFGSSHVSSTDHRWSVVGECLYQIFYKRGFAGASHRNIAHANQWRFELLRMQQFYIVQKITNDGYQPVNNREW